MGDRHWSERINIILILVVFGIIGRGRAVRRSGPHARTLVLWIPRPAVDRGPYHCGYVRGGVRALLLAVPRGGVQAPPQGGAEVSVAVGLQIQ